MKIALIGYGKMGKEIEQVILDQNKWPGQEVPLEIILKISDKNRHDLTVENLKQADVAIEFTQPDAAVRNIYTCFEAGVPVVVGTTAWLHHLPEVKEICEVLDGTLFYSPNYSIGVNIFWEINKKMASLVRAFPIYQVSIEEIHHTGKKDSPSGTAEKTANLILAELNRGRPSILSHENHSESQTELPIIAKREHDVPGTHTVTYTSNVDTIEITHEAKNRRGFAEGAVMAARFIAGKKGVFEMKDLLGLG